MTTAELKAELITSHSDLLVMHEAHSTRRESSECEGRCRSAYLSCSPYGAPANTAELEPQRKSRRFFRHTAFLLPLGLDSFSASVLGHWTLLYEEVHSRDMGKERMLYFYYRDRLPHKEAKDKGEIAAVRTGYLM